MTCRLKVGKLRNICRSTKLAPPAASAEVLSLVRRALPWPLLTFTLRERNGCFETVSYRSTCSNPERQLSRRTTGRNRPETEVRRLPNNDRFAAAPFQSTASDAESNICYPDPIAPRPPADAADTHLKEATWRGHAPAYRLRGDSHWLLIVCASLGAPDTISAIGWSTCQTRSVRVARRTTRLPSKRRG